MEIEFKDFILIGTFIVTSNQKLFKNKWLSEKMHSVDDRIIYFSYSIINYSKKQRDELLSKVYTFIFRVTMTVFLVFAILAYYEALSLQVGLIAVISGTLSISIKSVQELKLIIKNHLKHLSVHLTLLSALLIMDYMLLDSDLWTLMEPQFSGMTMFGFKGKAFWCFILLFCIMMYVIGMVSRLLTGIINEVNVLLLKSLFWSLKKVNHESPTKSLIFLGTIMAFIVSKCL